MLRHNFLLIYRNFKGFKSTFFINLIGLTAGLTCSLLIYLWVKDELNMDKFHEKDTRLFQVMTHKQNTGALETSPSTQAILAEALADEIPEIEYAVTSTGDANKFTLSGLQHTHGEGYMASEDFFNAFSYEVIYGDKSKLLADKKSIVISERLAIALFNTTQNSIGKVIEWQFPYGKGLATVTGVFKNIPQNSSMQFDLVLPFAVYKDLVGKESLHWGNYGCATFLVLKEESNSGALSGKIADFVKRKANDSNVTLFLQRYSEKYLYGRYEDGKQSGGRIEYVRLFSLIAIFILIIACINFMNLSTAKATTKMKDVGIKKAIGAKRKTLVLQFLMESLLMTLLSLLAALLIVDLFLPRFNIITGKPLRLTFDTELVFSCLTIAIFTGLIAGSYPALYLSSFNPAAVLKGRFNLSTKGFWARKGLVIFQFTLSVIFIVALTVIYKQIEFVQTKPLGYDKDNLIYIQPEGNALTSLETFLTELKSIPGVEGASTIARTIVGARNSTTGYFHWEGKDPNSIIPFEIVGVNYDMIETLGIKMKQGRAFSRQFSADTTGIIFNETAVQVMGLKDPIGKIFNLWGNNLTIIGVTEDFHFESLHEKVKPLFFKLEPKGVERVMIKLSAGTEKETLERLQQFYQNFNPGFQFAYNFVDDEYQAQYAAEKRVASLSRYFSVLAILISCLGLFGLAAFTAERRQKEIGIRKVLGSSDWGIVTLLSADFTKVVLSSIFIGLPLSYVITKSWLDGLPTELSYSGGIFCWLESSPCSSPVSQLVHKP